METTASNQVSAPPRAAHTVLLVDDNRTQLNLSRLRLQLAGFQVEVASSGSEALEKARQHVPDVILSDVVMDEMDGFGLCRHVRQEPSLASVPVVLVTAHFEGESNRELARRVGASALIFRTSDFQNELAALRECLEHGVPAASSASETGLDQAHLRATVNNLVKLAVHTRVADQRYQALFENSLDTITVSSLDGVILEANRRWQDILHIPAHQMIGRHVLDFVAPGEEAASRDALEDTVRTGSLPRQAFPLRRADGTIVFMEFSSTVLESDGGRVLFSIGHDVTERIRTTQALAAAETRYRTLVERLPDAIWACDVEGGIFFITSNIERICGYTVEEMCAEDVEQRYERIHPEERRLVRDAFQGLYRDGRPFDVEYRRRKKDGQWVWLRNRGAVTVDHEGKRTIEGLLSDVSERRVLEQSLAQAQKMEAIGRLTGGIAHDFNNILAAILANSHFLIDDLSEQDPRRVDAQEIKLSAERAAALTRQLLAFSRKQVLALTVIDLNTVTAGLERMLRRLVGEDIEMRFGRGTDLGSVRADVGQIEQVIMNLVVNSRDAMPRGGKLTIETANATLDEEASLKQGAAAGRYVMISVTDTGCGMDAETRRRIFEPFFTTKEQGQGTGLGLATCYGIVKQSGGHFVVSSEAGRGAVFQIYLPRVDAPPEVIRTPRPSGDLEGNETVLVLEDEERVRTAVTRMLRGRGYRVLVARNGAEAVGLNEYHDGPIDLVLSDVIMPGLSGPEVVSQLRESRPRIRVLYMSGYSDHPLLRDGELQAGMNFIQKPFAPDILARKVREVLDS